MASDLEHQEQVKIFNWTKKHCKKYPELSFLFAIPNGGRRHYGTAVKLKREGVKSGLPDLFLPVSRNKYHGLFIELKVKKNKPSGNQLIWHLALKKLGYKVNVCYGFEETIKVLKQYLNIIE